MSQCQRGRKQSGSVGILSGKRVFVLQDMLQTVQVIFRLRHFCQPALFGIHGKTGLIAVDPVILRVGNGIMKIQGIGKQLLLKDPGTQLPEGTGGLLEEKKKIDG